MASLIESTLPTDIQNLMNPDRIAVRVRAIRYQGEGLNEYEFESLCGEKLPEFSPGSHIDIYFRDGRVRQYSLCGDELDLARYRVVIQLEKDGRGGSRDIFDRVHVGQTLVISRPRNNFKLVSAERYVLIAGGIGITPIVSMARKLAREEKPFVLHYCTRSVERTALLDEVIQLCPAGSLHIYHDGGNPKNGADLDAILGPVSPDAHLFYCGPGGLMQVIAEKVRHWAPGHVHAEHFAVPTASKEATDASSASSFEVVLASTQESFKVPEDKSILDVLRVNGYDIPSSCEVGLCGTCRVRYLEGTPDHRDLVLQDDEKAQELLVCCSRSLSKTLVLDL